MLKECNDKSISISQKINVLGLLNLMPVSSYRDNLCVESHVLAAILWHHFTDSCVVTEMHVDNMTDTMDSV